MTFWKTRRSSLLRDDKNAGARSQGKQRTAALLSQRAALGLMLGMAAGVSFSTSPAFAIVESETGEPIIGKSIASTVAGRRIYLSVPFGGEFPLYYQKDGRVDGSGEAIGLGKYLSPTDSGKWWVNDNKLCQQWSQWYDGKVFCFKLEKLPDDKLIWRRDDGYEGVARIGD